jgi:general secretion pathway protein D
VLIEATVAEVTLNDTLRFGVQWFIDTGGGGSIAFSTGEDASVPSSFPGLSVRYLGGDYRFVLNALSSVTDVQVLSTPRILVLANETANLQVGDQVPVVTQQAVGIDEDSRIINSVEYRDTGVVLKVTPRVGDRGRMFIEIEQEVSEVAGTTTSDIDSPTIQQRRFNTHVQVEDGQVIALGGLIRSNNNVGDTGVPLLKDLPVLGGLFRARNRTTRQTELVVFLRPRIVRTRNDAEAVTEELAGRLEALGMRRDAR